MPALQAVLFATPSVSPYSLIAFLSLPYRFKTQKAKHRLQLKLACASSQDRERVQQEQRARGQVVPSSFPRARVVVLLLTVLPPCSKPRSDESFGPIFTAE